MMARWVAVVSWIVGLSLGGPAIAEDALDPQLQVAHDATRAELIAAGREDLADELTKQFEAYRLDPTYRQAVHQAVIERMQAARREFASRYARLIAEGRQADADRLLQLFIAYVQGIP